MKHTQTQYLKFYYSSGKTPAGAIIGCEKWKMYPTRLKIAGKWFRIFIIG